MIPPKITDVFGYHFHYPIRKNHKVEAHAKKAINYLLNPVGYLPVAGIVAGLARIYFFTKYYSRLCKESDLIAKHKRFFQAEIIRGVFELTPYRYLLLIPDIIFTVNRCLFSENRTKPHVTR